MSDAQQVRGARRSLRRPGDDQDPAARLRQTEVGGHVGGFVRERGDASRLARDPGLQAPDQGEAARGLDRWRDGEDRVRRPLARPAPGGAAGGGRKPPRPRRRVRGAPPPRPAGEEAGAGGALAPQVSGEVGIDATVLIFAVECPGKDLFRIESGRCSH